MPKVSSKSRCFRQRFSKVQSHLGFSRFPYFATSGSFDSRLWRKRFWDELFKPRNVEKLANCFGRTSITRQKFASKNRKIGRSSKMERRNHHKNRTRIRRNFTFGLPFVRLRISFERNLTQNPNSFNKSSFQNARKFSIFRRAFCEIEIFRDFLEFADFFAVQSVFLD